MTNHRVSSVLFTAAGAALCFLLAAGTAFAQVRGAWVSNDRTVDCSSYQTILRDVLKPAMTDEQKAIALYNFYRQMVYHYLNVGESREPVKCINVIGNTLCGSQATCMKGLLAAAGLKARVVSHPGHTFYEVYYGEKWHGYDTMTNFYVFTRGDGRNVASFAELAADPSLIKDAEKDGRSCPGIVPCGDEAMAFASKIQITDYEPMKSTWSVKDYALRPGEEIVRSWWPMGKPVPGTYSGKNPGPLHTCGTRDRKNPPELYRFWEPYGIPKFGGTTVSYRHYFNGTMTYSPDLAAKDLAEPLAKGELVVPVKCPFYVAGATLALQAECPGDGDAVAVAASTDGGKRWTDVAKAADKGVKDYVAVLDGAVEPKVGRHEYQVRFRPAGNAVLKEFNLRTIFTHNAMAAPHLMPGANQVTVTADDAEAVKANGLTVVYRYKDAPAWTAEKTIEKEITRVPTTFAADLPAGDKLPQMQDLTIRCGKLHWRPKVESIPDKVVCDLADKAAAADWKADPDIRLSHDGTGLVLAVEAASQYPQASLDKLKLDWSAYKNVVVELDNLRDATQKVVFRVRSNDSNDERTDVDWEAGKGPGVMRIPIAGLKKTKVSAITRIYVLLLDVPAAGCKIRVRKIYLEPERGL
jgi:hypothetical protein